MAYQPVQLGRIGSLAGLDHVGNALTDALDSYQRNRQQAIENLRNRQQDERVQGQDFQKAYLDAAKLARSGDTKGAQALMSRYGAVAGQREIGGAPARYEQETVAPQAPPNLTGQMGDDPNAIAEQTAAEDWQASNKTPTVRQRLVSAAQAGRKVPTVTGKFGGQEWSIDPEAQRETRAASLQEALGKLDPATRAQYEQILPGILMSNADVDVSDIVRSLGANANLRQKQEAQGIKSSEFKQTFDQRAELRREGLKQSDINSQRAAQARIAAARLMAMPGLKNDAANRGDVGKMEAAVKNYFTVADAKGQLKNMNALHAAHTNINVKGENTAVAHRDALVQLARFFRGTVPTEGEMKVLYDHIGGVYGSIDAFEKRLESGDISDAMVMNLQNSTDLALQEANARRGQMFGGLAHIVGPQSPYKLMGPQVNEMAKGYADLFGVVDMPDIIPTEPGYQGTVLGAGRRPGPPPAPARRPAGPGAPKKKTADDYLKEDEGP